MVNWVVAGGGFRGIVAANYLAQAGHRVTLVERAPFLGAILRSEEWRGLYLDKGCQLFDNVDDASTELCLDILGDQAVPLAVKYGSLLGPRRSDDASVPDLSDLPRATQQVILMELLERAAAPDGPAPRTLAEATERRFGPTAARHLAPVARKMFRRPPEKLDPAAAHTAPLRRVRLFDEPLAALLKRVPELDERIAASSAGDPMRFYRSSGGRFGHRNFYPAGRGMRTFCDRAEARLAERGVALRLGTAVEALRPGPGGLALTLQDGGELACDRLLWALDIGQLAQLALGENPTAALVEPVPMVLFYARLGRDQVGDHTYVQDFRPGTLTLRWSAAGFYGGQQDAEGRSYVCFEVPTEADSAVWRDPEAHIPAIWREGLGMGVVRGEAPAEWKTLKAPVTYRAMKPGFGDAVAETAARIAAVSDRIVNLDQAAFARVDLIRSIREAC
ncbi:MAG TPA: FAD-dependent oxidoreductase [Alphaproteobacteria bacterium]|nr:FAD-dependent oxidoreductase [Alphaproteobacteria bacterium]